MYPLVVFVVFFFLVCFLFILHRYRENFTLDPGN